MEEKTSGLAQHFGANLAKLLADKIAAEHKTFEKQKFINAIKRGEEGKALTQRVELIADNLKLYLPGSYKKAAAILTAIMGPENPNETGMFKNYYWLMPVGKFIEKYGLEDFATSVKTIGELTKRNTGEYAIRPYVRKYPKETLLQMKAWALADNFHLRRLASEGLRPKLPWAAKLDLFIENPKPVFQILNMLKKEEVKFVKKSVANHLTDYIKVNPAPTYELLDKWRIIDNEHTQWMIAHATRKQK